jgi:hypothetical protein
MIFKRAKKEPEAGPPMDLEACKKLIYRDYDYEKMKPELKSLVDAKDKSFAESLLAIACRFDEDNWINYNYDYVISACESLRVMGDGSVVRPILEFLDASHDHDNYQKPFEYQLKLLDALVPPSGWEHYRDLLDRLAKRGRNLGKFAADRLLMLDAALAGAYDRLAQAANSLAHEAGEADFQAALGLLESDRSDLAIRYLVMNTAAASSRSARTEKIEDALARIGASAIPQLLRVFDEESSSSSGTEAIGILEKMGEAGAPALIARMRDKKDSSAYEALKRLFKAGRMSADDKQALWAMKGMTLRSHSDNTANCGVHLDTPGLDVDL